MTMNSQQYAHLADHCYGRALGGAAVDFQALVEKPVEIEGVRYRVLAHADKPSGYQGTIYQRLDTGDIVVAHRGTELGGSQTWRDGVLTDGGMLAARTNLQARDAIELTRTALEMARTNMGEYDPAPEVTVTGHSLGGTLAQITAHHFDLRGETFNAYGAASLEYRIPETRTPKVVNHAMAGDACSASGPHYGEVRIYAKPEEVRTLAANGYHQSRVLDAVTPDHPVRASINGSHSMHHFTESDGAGGRDASVLGDPAARERAQAHARAIADYRSDVRVVRAAGMLGIDAARALQGGPAAMAERVREALQPPLPAGEPARREAQTHARGESVSEAAPRPSEIVRADVVRADASRPDAVRGVEARAEAGQGDARPAREAQADVRSADTDRAWATQVDAGQVRTAMPSPLAGRFIAELPGLAPERAEAMAAQAQRQTGVSDPQQLGIWVKGDQVVAYAQAQPLLRTDAMRADDPMPEARPDRDATLVQASAVAERAGRAMGA